MKRNDLNNLQNAVRLAIDKSRQVIDTAFGLMSLCFNSNTYGLTEEKIVQDAIKGFPTLDEIEIEYTQWEDERYSVSFFLENLSNLSDYFITIKVLIKKGMLPSWDNPFDFLNAINFYPCLFYMARSVVTLKQRIEDEYKVKDWAYEDMRDYVPYNRVKKFISHNLSHYAKKHQAPIVEDFCAHVLKSLEKFADGADEDEIGEISFKFYYLDKKDQDICCEFDYDCFKIVHYGWDDVDPLDGGLFEWWSYILHEDGCGEGKIGDMDISEEIDGGMLLEITEPEEFLYGQDK